jgi:hypothetical protein
MDSKSFKNSISYGGFMRIFIIGLLIAIFFTANFAQQKIGVTFLIKEGETVKIEGLTIRYLGKEKEWASGWDAEGKRIEIDYDRYRFEIEKNGKKVEVSELLFFKTDGFAIEILGRNSDAHLKNNSPDAIEIVVKTVEQFDREINQSRIQVINATFLDFVIC